MPTNRVIVILHGIHTSKAEADRWMPALGLYLAGDRAGTVVDCYRYGWRSGTMMRLPVVGYCSRRRRVRAFQRHVAELRQRYLGARIDVVAHSYGTWIAHYAMMKGEPEARTWYDRIVYMGSIVHGTEYERTVPVGAALNLYSPLDKVVRIAPGFGESGTHGFSPIADGRCENRLMVGYGHGDYTQPGPAWTAALEFLK